MRLGVHVSIGKGLAGAVDQAQTLGCDGFQMFVANPRGWARKPLAENEINLFKNKRKAAGLWPVVVHLAYLPNPASEDPELYEKSVITLMEEFRRANLLEADFLVFHPGKNKARQKGIARVIKAVNLVLTQVSGPTLMLFENQAGAGGEIAGGFEEIQELISGISVQERVGICFDTCHAFAAGYDLSSREGWEKTLSSVEKTVGLSSLKLFHLNDSMGLLGSRLDRHQHIGVGNIGLNGFKYLVNHPKLNQLPGILETPQKSADDDLKNLAALRQLSKEKD
jgi:deoxyribonuclease-4